MTKKKIEPTRWVLQNARSSSNASKIGKLYEEEERPSQSRRRKGPTISQKFEFETKSCERERYEKRVSRFFYYSSIFSEVQRTIDFILIGYNSVTLFTSSCRIIINCPAQQCSHRSRDIFITACNGSSTIPLLANRDINTVQHTSTTWPTIQ